MLAQYLFGSTGQAYRCEIFWWLTEKMTQGGIE
jgi:hypothetical protein